MSTAQDIFEDLEISSNDKRKYRYFTLPNSLKVLLISDPETEKCSACCDVHIGSLSDPNDIQGLAHFLEHMLFMGTEKYPEENEYSVYISAHGGYSNAYTSLENTVYYFDIQNNYFENALDYFATFFWCPLFNESSLFRELQAVDNENTKNLQSDSWRTYQLLKSLAKSNHPLNKFSTGNLETLKTIPEQLNINLRERLLQFHQEYYSANLMTLVLYGNQPLDILQQWAEEKFLFIENKKYSIPRLSLAPYGPEELGVLIEMVPVKDLKDIEIYIPLPSVQDHYRVKPIDHLCHLVGHEGAGSILSNLKQLGWANHLGSMLHTSQTDFSIFSVTIGLTDSGLDHIHEIITIFFEYIGMINREGPQQWIANEVKETHDLAFRFLNKIEPSDYVVRLANAMHVYPKEHIISGDKLIFDTENGFDLIRHLLATYFVPDNCAVLVKHKGFQGKTTQEERWYGTQYTSRPFPPEALAAWTDAAARNGNQKIRASLHLPVPNLFIATDFTLYEVEEEWKEAHEYTRQNGPVLIEKQFFEDETMKSLYCMEEEQDEKEELEEKEEEKSEQVDSGDEEEEEEAPAPSAQEASNALELTQAKKSLVWFLQDSIWKVPKVNVFLSLKTGYAYHSPLDTALCELFAETIKENLSEFTYYADCAGIYYDISQTYSGFDLSFSGYHDKLPLLITQTLQEMMRLSSPPVPGPPSSSSIELFARLKEKILRSYSNSLFLAPYNHCLVGTLMCLEDPRWSTLDKYHALKAATFENFQAFSGFILKQLFLEMFITGNINTLQCNHLSQLIQSSCSPASSDSSSRSSSFVPLTSSLEPCRRSVELDPKYEYHYRQCALQTNPNELNSAIENSYFIYEHAGIGDLLPSALEQEAAIMSSTDSFSDEIRQWSSLAHSAVLAFLSHVIAEPLFDQLRTKEQLGYLVHASPTTIGSQCGLRIIVQSNSRDPLYLDGRIESFLTDYESILQNLTTEEFEHNRQAVIEMLLEKPKNINSESKEHWYEISKNLYLFNRKKIQASLVRRVRLEDVLLFYRTYLLPSEVRRKFSSQFFGQGKKIAKKAVTAAVAMAAAGGKEILVIDNATKFKRSVPLRPFRSHQDKIEVYSHQSN